MENKNTPNVPPVKSAQSGEKKKSAKYILIPVIAVILAGAAAVSIILVKNKNKPAPVEVTDENGVVITNVDGTPVTVVPETEYVQVTDANGEAVTDANGTPVTTAVYKEVIIEVPVTDLSGDVVTNKNGEVEYETKKFTPEMNENEPGKNQTDKQTEKEKKNVSTSAVALTDGQGNTGVDASGNPITTMVEITEAPTADIDPAAIDWKFTQGGTAVDYISDIILTSDKAYITANITNSKDGDFKEFSEAKYATPYTVLTKTDASGKTVWKKAVGNKGIFVTTSLAPCSDGSFYAAGYGKKVDGNTYGYYDCFVSKFNKDGEQIWLKRFGTSTVDLINGITVTKDGGAVAVGSVGNNDNDAAGFGGKSLQSRAVIIKYSADGDLVWKNIVGGNQDYFNAVTEGKDGNIYVVGNFYSGELFTPLGKSDSGIVKFTSEGKYKAVTPIAGTGIENFTGIITDSEGNIVVVGRSDSADISNPSSFFKDDLVARGDYDAYIIKFSTSLDVLRATAFRGQNADNLTDLTETPEGLYIAVGYTNSSTRDLKGVTTRGGNDIVIAAFDKSCDLLWARSFGGTLDDSAQAVCLGADGGYAVAGKTISTNVDLEGIGNYASSGKTLGVVVKFPE